MKVALARLTLGTVSWQGCDVELRPGRLSRITGTWQGSGRGRRGRACRGTPLDVGGAARVFPAPGPVSKATSLSKPQQQISQAYLCTQMGTHLSCADQQGWHPIPDIQHSLWDMGKKYIRAKITEGRNKSRNISPKHTVCTPSQRTPRL